MSELTEAGLRIAADWLLQQGREREAKEMRAEIDRLRAEVQERDEQIRELQSLVAGVEPITIATMPRDRFRMDLERIFESIKESKP